MELPDLSALEQKPKKKLLIYTKTELDVSDEQLFPDDAISDWLNPNNWNDINHQVSESVHMILTEDGNYEVSSVLLEIAPVENPSANG